MEVGVIPGESLGHTPPRSAYHPAARTRDKRDAGSNWMKMRESHAAEISLGSQRPTSKSAYETS